MRSLSKVVSRRRKWHWHYVYNIIYDQYSTQSTVVPISDFGTASINNVFHRERKENIYIL